MLHTPLTSTMMSSAGYEDGILEIEFKSNRKRYRYQATQLVFDTLIASTSPGQFFLSNIKGKLPIATVDTTPPAPMPEMPVNAKQGYTAKMPEDIVTPVNRSGDYPSMANEEEIDI